MSSVPQVTLYYSPGSCSQAVRYLLHHLNVPYSPIALRLAPSGYEAADGSFNNAQYRSVHPAGYVPALKLTNADGSHDIVTEVPAILSYITGLAPEQGLLGRTPLEKAKVLEWTTWLSGTVHGACLASLLRPVRFAGPGVHRMAEETLANLKGNAPTVDSAMDGVLAVISENGRQSTLACFERIEKKVGNGGFAVGDILTVVDFYLVFFWVIGWKKFGVDMPNGPRWKSVMRRLLEMKSVEEIVKEEKLEEWAVLDGPTAGK